MATSILTTNHSDLSDPRHFAKSIQHDCCNGPPPAIRRFRSSRRTGGREGSSWDIGAQVQRIQARVPNRLRFEERYANKRVYLGKITNAALNLEKQGFPLDEGVAKLRDRAAREWDYVASMP